MKKNNIKKENKKDKFFSGSGSWICCKCGRVYAIWVKECEWCNDWVGWQSSETTAGTDGQFKE